MHTALIFSETITPLYSSYVNVVEESYRTIFKDKKIKTYDNIFFRKNKPFDLEDFYYVITYEDPDCDCEIKIYKQVDNNFHIVFEKGPVNLESLYKMMKVLYSKTRKFKKFEARKLLY